MSGQYVRLPDSKRNELISKFNKGVIDPDYEVIPSKNTEGRYTIRKRKVQLPVPDQPTEESPVQSSQRYPGGRQEGSEGFDGEPDNQEQLIPQEDIDPYLDDRAYMPQIKLNKNAMFRELQIQMNKMMIENMKLMRQQIKNTEKKRQKLKDKSKKMSMFLSKVLDEAEKEEPEPQEEPEPVEESNTPMPQPEEEEQKEEDEVIPASRHLNQYEDKLDDLAGDSNPGYSRRDRLHFERFNI